VSVEKPSVVVRPWQNRQAERPDLGDFGEASNQFELNGHTRHAEPDVTTPASPVPRSTHHEPGLIAPEP
jgi:hypothetical protein